MGARASRPDGARRRGQRGGADRRLADVQDAINKGIVPQQRAPPDDHVGIYLGVAAVGWVLQAQLIRGLAHDRPGDRDRPATQPVRPSHQPLAPLLLAAEGGLDHRAPDERRRRRLGRPLAGDADARLERHPSACGSHRAPHRRLAARPGLVRRAAAGAHPLALVPAGLACRERRAAQPDRRGHRADRRVGRGDGGRAGVQPRAPLPGRVRRAQRREPGPGDVRPEDLLDLLPVDRVPRRARDGVGPLLRLAPLRSTTRSRSGR